MHKLHMPASGNRNTGLEDKMLIAPLVAKKNLYAGKMEGIHS